MPRNLFEVSKKYMHTYSHTHTHTHTHTDMHAYSYMHTLCSLWPGVKQIDLKKIKARQYIAARI